jgi:hypothetical protein
MKFFELFEPKRKPRRYVVWRYGSRWEVKRSRKGYYLKNEFGMGGYWPTLDSLRAECQDMNWVFQRE